MYRSVCIQWLCGKCVKFLLLLTSTKLQYFSTVLCFEDMAAYIAKGIIILPNIVSEIGLNH